MFLYRVDMFIFTKAGQNRRQFDIIDKNLSIDIVGCQIKWLCRYRCRMQFVTKEAAVLLLLLDEVGLQVQVALENVFFFHTGLIYFLILLILWVVGCWLSGAGVDCRCCLLIVCVDCRSVFPLSVPIAPTLTLDMCTVKKGQRFSRPQLRCH